MLVRAQAIAALAHGTRLALFRRLVQERAPHLPIEIDAALRGLSQREREICRWILNQERPVNMHQAAEHFHLSRRHFSRLLHNILYQLAEAA